MPLSTQSKHPHRATVRTVLAAVVALLPLLPAIVDEFHLGAIPAVAAALVIVGTITRVLAMPDVEAWLHEYVPWLAAQPAPPKEGQ